MIAYSKNTSVSLNKSNVNDFFPIISIDRVIEKFEVSKDDEFATLHNLLQSGHYIGGAIFSNDDECEILESIEGVSGGGELYVLDKYILIAYLNQDTFKIFKKDGAVMVPNFTRISPVSYIASTAARFLGQPCNGYLPYFGGVIESYNTESPLNLPEFERCLISNGQPFAYYGLATGTLGLNFVPNSKKGMSNCLIRNKLFGSQAKKYSADEGVVLNSTIRAKAQTLVSNIKAGRDLGDLSWCKIYISPRSLLLNSPASFYCLKQLSKPEYEVCQNISFPPSTIEVGPGVREYVNEPSFETCQFTQCSPDVAQILAQYEALLEAMKKEGLIQGTVVSINELALIYETLMKTFVSGERTFSFDFKWFSKPVTVKAAFDGMEVPKPNIAIERTTSAALNGLNSQQLSLKYSEVMTKASQVSKAVDLVDQEISVGSEKVVLTRFKFNREKFNKIFTDFSEVVLDSVENKVKSVFSAIERSTGTFNPGKVFYTYKKGCKKITEVYDAYSTWQNYCRCPAQNFIDKVGINSDGSYCVNPDPGRSFGDVMKMDDIVIDDIRYDAANHCLNFSYRFGMNVLLSGMLHGGYSEASAQDDAVRYIRDVLHSVDPTIGVSANGISNGNPFNLPYKGGPCKVSGFLFWKKLSAGQDYGSPLFRIGVRINSTVKNVYEPQFADDTTEEMMNAVEKNIKAINKSASDQAVKWLVDELSKNGLLENCLICGKIEQQLVPLNVVNKFANFDTTTSALIFYRAFNALKKSGAQFDERTSALINFNLEELAKSLKLCGVTVDGESPIATPREFELPWVMDLEHMTYETKGMDYNLLPFYCEM